MTSGIKCGPSTRLLVKKKKKKNTVGPVKNRGQVAALKCELSARLAFLCVHLFMQATGLVAASGN